MYYCKSILVAINTFYMQALCFLTLFDHRGDFSYCNDQDCGKAQPSGSTLWPFAVTRCWAACCHECCTTAASTCGLSTNVRNFDNEAKTLRSWTSKVRPQEGSHYITCVRVCVCVSSLVALFKRTARSCGAREPDWSWKKQGQPKLARPGRSRPSPILRASQALTQAAGRAVGF